MGNIRKVEARGKLRKLKAFGRSGLWLAAACLGIGLAFTSASAAAGACPNAELRTGMSAQLPDCRAYELVSPPDSNGRPLGEIRQPQPFDLFPTELISPNRDSIVYGTVNEPLGDLSEANGSTDGYEAVRFSDGWETVRRLTPSGAQAVQPDPGGVSADHQYAFLFVPTIAGEGAFSGSLAASGSADYLGKPDGSFELTGVGSLGTEPLVQGMFISPSGSHVIFQSGGVWCSDEGAKCLIRKLEPDAPPTGTPAIYDRAVDGPTHVVSLLPNNAPPAAGEGAAYQGASPDGSVIAFKVGGALYVRINDSKTEKVADGPATYAGISSDAGKVFYVSAGNIYEFEVSSGVSKQVNASGDAEPVNISADGSHVYFISPSALDGAKGTVGMPNLYVWLASSDATRYVATVLPSDLEHTSQNFGTFPGLATWTDWAVSAEREHVTGKNVLGPGADSSRTTPDGAVLVFESRATLTSYENAGHTEIYRYDSITEELQCVSCNPLISAAQNDSRLQELFTARPATIVHNVSDDGSRVFFETPEALVSRDVDGINDIYEWHEGTGDEGPELDLISSGKSQEYPPSKENPPPIPLPNIILGISPSGSDVLFLSEDALVSGAGEGGASALYDARIDGGFPGVVSPAQCSDRAGCQGEGSMAEPFPLLQSDQVRGSGNVKHRRHCHRSSRKGPKGAKHRKCPIRQHRKARGR